MTTASTAGFFDCRRVPDVVGAAEIPSTKVLSLLTITTGVAADDGIAKPFQMSAVDLGDEAATKKRDVYRRRHRFMISRGGTRLYSGSRNAMISPGKPPPLMASAMYCRPSCM